MPENDPIVEFKRRGERVRTLLTLCLTEPTPDNIHDLRVAIRRYLAGLDCLKNCTPKLTALKKARKTIKSLLDAYDQIRDLHVMIDHLSENERIFKPNSPFLSYLRAESEQLEKCGTLITEEAVDHARKQLNKIDRTVQKKIERVTRKAAYRSLDAAFKAVMDRVSAIDSADPNTIHRTRIAFKKFRYSIEFFSMLIESPPEDLFPRSRQIQTALGEVQDASVLLDAMARFERLTDPRMLNDLERAYVNERLSTSIDVVIKSLPKFKALWRADRDHPLPWLIEPTPNELSHFIEKLK